MGSEMCIRDSAWHEHLKDVMFLKGIGFYDAPDFLRPICSIWVTFPFLHIEHKLFETEYVMTFFEE